MWVALMVVFALLTAALIALPWLRPAAAWDARTEPSKLDELLGEKARIMRVLADLESERRAELMDDAAYEDARREYLERAVRLNRELAESTGIDPVAEGVS